MYFMIRVYLKGARGFSLRIESGSSPENWNAIYLFSSCSKFQKQKPKNGVYVMLKSYSMGRKSKHHPIFCLLPLLM